MEPFLKNKITFKNLFKIKLKQKLKTLFQNPF